jgi:hypothetical protein
LKVKCSSSIGIGRIPPKLKMLTGTYILQTILDIGHIRYDEGIYPESDVRLGFGYLIALCSPPISVPEFQFLLCIVDISFGQSYDKKAVDNINKERNSQLLERTHNFHGFILPEIEIPEFRRLPTRKYTSTVQDFVSLTVECIY